jgi:hypothetical protein
VAIKLDKFSVCMLFALPKHWFARLPALNASGVHDLMPHDAADVPIVKSLTLGTMAARPHVIDGGQFASSPCGPQNGPGSRPNRDRSPHSSKPFLSVRLC